MPPLSEGGRWGSPLFHEGGFLRVLGGGGEDSPPGLPLGLLMEFLLLSLALSSDIGSLFACGFCGGTGPFISLLGLEGGAGGVA